MISWPLAYSLILLAFLLGLFGWRARWLALFLWASTVLWGRLFGFL